MTVGEVTSLEHDAWNCVNAERRRKSLKRDFPRRFSPISTRQTGISEQAKWLFDHRMISNSKG